MDQSHRGHDAIVGDLHLKLAAEGEECHEVDCTEHGGHDVKYARGPVSRARVSFILPLPFNDFELDKFRWTILLARLSNEQFLSHSKENGLAISFTHPVPQGWA